MTAIPDAQFGSCPLDAWLARQCGAATSRDLPARLAQKQLHLLRSTLDQAMRGAFYATRLQGRERNLTTLEDLRHLPQVFAHARRSRRIMLQNVGLSLALITILIPLALFGVLGLAAVVLVHELAEVVVIANGVRAGRARALTGIHTTTTSAHQYIGAHP